MTESTKPCEVGEANKLLGIQNYNMWKIKMEAILRRERLWRLAKTNRSITIFSTVIDGVSYPSEEKFRSKKHRARLRLILSIVGRIWQIVGYCYWKTKSSRLVGLIKTNV
jgi:hypothetical protein